MGSTNFPVGFVLLMHYRASSIPARAGLCLTPSLASIDVGKISALKSFGTEPGLVFLDISVALQLTSGLVWSRPRPAGRAPPRKPSNLQVRLQPSVVTGLEAAVSIAAAILSPLGNQRACSKTNQVKFVVVLSSAAVTSWEHVRFGGGEQSPSEGVFVWEAGPGGTAGQKVSGAAASVSPLHRVVASCRAAPARAPQAFEF